MKTEERREKGVGREKEKVVTGFEGRERERRNATSSRER